MTDAGVLELAQRALMVAILVAAPTLTFGLVVGLIVSIFQAATQIQEMTLTFVPKILAIVVALFLFGPWMLSSLVHFSSHLLTNIPDMIK